MSDSEVLPMHVDEVLIVKPGDTLIVRFSHGSPNFMSAAVEMRRALLAKMPGLAEVIVLNADGLAVYRPDEVEP